MSVSIRLVQFESQWSMYIAELSFCFSHSFLFLSTVPLSLAHSSHIKVDPVANIFKEGKCSEVAVQNEVCSLLHRWCQQLPFSIASLHQNMGRHG